MPTPRYSPLFTQVNGQSKRDKARRYLDTESGEIVSRRKAENLTQKQRETKQNRRSDKAQNTRFIVKKHQDLAKFTVYRIRAKNEKEAVRAFANSKQAQKLKPAMIKVVARGLIQANNDSGHSDKENTKYQWRTIISPSNPNDFLKRQPELLREAESAINHSFDAAPVEISVLLYVAKNPGTGK